MCICRLNSEVEQIFILERNALKVYINKTDPLVSLAQLMCDECACAF